MHTKSMDDLIELANKQTLVHHRDLISRANMVDAAEYLMQIPNFDMRQRNAKSCESTVLAMPKHVIKFVLEVVRNGALRFYTCSNV